MIRKLALAAAAVAAIGAMGLSTTDAFAKKGGWHKSHGIHIGIGHGYGYGIGHGYGWNRGWGPRVGFYTPYFDDDCYRIRTRRGHRIVCRY